MGVVGMIRAWFFRTEPEVPFEVLRDGRPVLRDLGVLRPDGAVRPVMDLAQLADDAFLDAFDDPTVFGAAAVGEQMRGDTGFAGGLEDEPTFGETIGDGLVHEDMAALLHGGDGDGGMQVVRRHHLDGVEVRFLLEELAEVDVSRAALEVLASLV